MPNVLKAICLTAAIAALVPAPAAAQAGVRTASYLPPESELAALLGAFDVPGLAIATLTGCEPDGVRTAGIANLGTSAAVTERTAFEAASLSKPVFAWIVLSLAGEGRIELDQPLAETRAEPRIADSEAYARLTPRMVLAHQTGLPNWAGDTSGGVRDHPIAFEGVPGSGFFYSGEAYELLRRHVETQTGETLDQLFEHYLGAAMPHSGFSGPLGPDRDAAMAYASTRRPESARAIAFEGGAAGGLVTTPADYANFLGMVCSGTGLDAALHDAMLTPVTPVPAGEYPAPTAWGLGWAIMQMGEETIILHGGNNGEFRSLAALLPSTGEGYVFFANGRNGSDLFDAMIEALQ